MFNITETALLFLFDDEKSEETSSHEVELCDAGQPVSSLYCVCAHPIHNKQHYNQLEHEQNKLTLAELAPNHFNPSNHTTLN